MDCPKHPGTKLRKARLDVYWCRECRRAWLIHKLSSYKSFEEAAKTNYEEQLEADFLEPLRDPHKT